MVRFVFRCEKRADNAPYLFANNRMSRANKIMSNLLNIILTRTNFLLLQAKMATNDMEGEVIHNSKFKIRLFFISELFSLKIFDSDTLTTKTVYFFFF